MNINDHTRTILHVDMNAFFASVEQATHPHTRGKPVAIIGAADRTVVLAASYDAKKYGVRTGCTKYTAAARCADLIFITAQPYKYMDVSCRIMRALHTYTPDVEVCSIDEAFLDITNSLSLFGSPEVIARRIKKDIRALADITCSIGIAPNKLLAKLAANLQKPDGLVIFHPDDLPDCLRDIPVDMLCGVGPRTTAWLHRHGIRTCGDAQKIPYDLLRRRFGRNGIWLYNAVRGRDDSAIITQENTPAPHSIGNSMTLHTSVYGREELSAYIVQLADMTGARLRKAVMAAHTLSLFLRYASFQSEMRSVTTHIPLYFTDDIVAAARRALDACHANEPVRALGIHLSHLQYQYQPATLFPEDARRVTRARLQDSINAHFGPYTLMPAALVKRHTRERVISPVWRPKTTHTQRTE